MSWAKPIPKKITSWSYSRWAVYAECPLKAKYKFIDKLPEPGSPAMERGNVIHKIAEQFVKGETKTAAVPEPLKPFADLFKQLRKEAKKEPDRFNVESTWAFRSDWSETTWNDWNGCWLRVKIDAARFSFEEKDCITIDVYDWKTGKFSPQYNVHQYMMQQHLYGTSALQRYAGRYKYVIVRPHLVFLDAGVEYTGGEGDPIVYTDEQKKPMVKEWTNRVKPMLNDSTFKATPGNACRFCHFKKSNGGPCKFGD